MKPTKSQRRRSNERARKEQDKKWEKMGPAPADDDNLFGPGNVDGLLDIPSAERAPAHVVDYDPLCEDDAPTFKQGALTALSKAAGDTRAESGEAQAERLRAKYPQHDGKRGGAGKAHAAAWAQYEIDREAGVTEDGEVAQEPPSLRTFQRALAPQNESRAGAKK